MIPVTSSPSLPAYSSYLLSRSTSRMRWRMTCLAVCAAMRPKSSGVSSHSLTTWPSSSSSCAITRISPVSTSISTSASSAEFGIRLYAVTRALARASSMISMEMPFSRSMFSRASIISEFMGHSAPLRRTPCNPRLRFVPCSSRHFLLLASVALGARRRAPFEDRSRLHDLVVRQALVRAVEVDVDTGIVGSEDHPAPAEAAGLRTGLDRHETADRSREVRRQTQWAFQPGAADLERVRARQGRGDGRVPVEHG